MFIEWRSESGVLPGSTLLRGQLQQSARDVLAFDGGAKAGGVTSNSEDRQHAGVAVEMMARD
ncbi:MAG TPA: hypothetical protein VFV25_10035, partial [Methylibium sp.]